MDGSFTEITAEPGYAIESPAIESPDVESIGRTGSSRLPAKNDTPRPAVDEAAQRRDLNASLIDAGGYSVMVGAGETYFGPFSLALGLSAAATGLMVTVPVLTGSLLQLCTPWMVKRVGSHRTWVAGGAALQVICLVVLSLTAFTTGSSAAMLLGTAITLYWAGGLSGGPPWNTWIEDVVPAAIRTRFFAMRQRLSQLCLLAGFIIAGVSLDYGRQGGFALTVFVGVFLMAALARSVSALSLVAQSEPSRGSYGEQVVSLKELFRSPSGSDAGSGWLVAYLLVMQVGVQFSGPYFAPFMLRQEKMSYLLFMLLFSVAFLGKALSMQWWGRVGQKYGPRRLLAIGGMAIIPLSALWTLSDDMPNLVVPFQIPWLADGGPVIVPGQVIAIALIQFLSGCTWSAYELAMSLMFLHGIPRERRTSLLTWYNFGNSLAMVLGSLLGASMFRIFGESHSTYMIIFWGSSFLRLFTLLLLARVR